MVSRNWADRNELSSLSLRGPHLQAYVEEANEVDDHKENHQEEDWSDDTASETSPRPPTPRHYSIQATSSSKPTSTRRTSSNQRAPSRSRKSYRPYEPDIAYQPAPNPGGQVYVPSSQGLTGLHDAYDQTNSVPSQPYQRHPYFHPPYPHQSQSSQTYPTNTYQPQPPQAYDPYSYHATPAQTYHAQAYPPHPQRAFEPQTYQYQPSQGFGTAPAPQWSIRTTDPHLQRKVNKLELDKRRSERKAQKERQQKDRAEARAAQLEEEARKRESKRRHDRSELREMKKTMDSLNHRIMEFQLDRLEVSRAQRMFPDYSLRDLRSFQQRPTNDISSDTNVGSDSLEDFLIEWLTTRKQQEQRRLITERNTDDSLPGSDSRGLQVGSQPNHGTLNSRLLKKMVQSTLFDLLQQSDRARTLGAHADDLDHQFDNRVKRKPRDYEAEASKMHKKQKELIEEAAQYPDDGASESLHETGESESEPSYSGLQRHNIRTQRSSPPPEKKVAMHERRNPRTSRMVFHPPDDSGYGSVIDRNSNRSRVSEISNDQKLGTGVLKGTRHDRPAEQNPTLSNIKRPKGYQKASVRDAHDSDDSSEGSDIVPMVSERKRAPYCKRAPFVEAPDPPFFRPNDHNQE